jgi:hypothetical protein
VKARLASSLLLLATAVAVCVRIPAALAQQAEGDAEAVVPSGQEELLGQMLGKGATLPDGCKLTEGHVEHVTVKATYACPEGEVVFEVCHPSRAGAGATRTDRFAITLRSGSPPASLEPALVSLIRAREAAFEWKWVGRPRGGSSSRTGLLAAVALLAIAVLGWVLRSRSSARGGNSS